MLIQGRRLEELIKIKNGNLFIQVSLDGSRPEHHDPYRGQGSWQKTVDGVNNLLESGFRVRLSTTETPANTEHLEEICIFRRSLGISDDDHIIRPLAKRGFSQEGMEVGKHNLVPELTINADGVYWHPLSTDADMRVSAEILPLADSISQIKADLETISNCNGSGMQEFQ
jgi:hypothetical protein